MKDFFENIKQTAYKGSKVVVDTTKNVMDSTKKEIDIQKIRHELNKCYRQIGVLTYKEKTGEISDASKQINELIQQIDSKIGMLEQLRNGEVYKNNAKSYEEESDTTKKIIKPEKNKEGYFIMRFCNYCNVGNHPDATHCVQCGHKLN